MSNMKDVRLLGLEDKNEFLDFFNSYSYLYTDILDKLGYSTLDNLVEIVRNKIYDMAEGYEKESEYYFYCSLSGDIIIQMFEHILREEYIKLFSAYNRLNNSSLIGKYLYYLNKDNWIIEYEALCKFCKDFRLEQVENEFFESFINTISKEPFLSRKDEFIKSLKIELRYLAKDNRFDSKVDKKLVKYMGDKI